MPVEDRNVPPDGSPDDNSLKRSSVAHAQNGVARMGMPRRPRAKLLGPIAAVAAIIYFLIDALFLSFIRPIAQALARLGMFSSLAAWAGSLGPYPTLALFLIPVAVLEPAKPVGAYLMATGHVTYGVLVIVTGEVIKITVVERLFHFSRDKLLSIPAFACVYNWITFWLECLRAQPIWRATMARLMAIKAAARRLFKWS